MKCLWPTSFSRILCLSGACVPLCSCDRKWKMKSKSTVTACFIEIIQRKRWGDHSKFGTHTLYRMTSSMIMRFSCRLCGSTPDDTHLIQGLDPFVWYILSLIYTEWKRGICIPPVLHLWNSTIIHLLNLKFGAEKREMKQKRRMPWSIMFTNIIMSHS